MLLIMRNTLSTENNLDEILSELSTILDSNKDLLRLLEEKKKVSMNDRLWYIYGFMRKRIKSITKQTDFNVGFFDFGKALQPNVRFFNPSIITRNDGNWLIARKSEGSENNGLGINSLVAFKLNQEHKPVEYIPINLTTRSYTNQHFEDPRITVINGKPWLSYCTFQILNKAYYTGAHQQVAVLNDYWQPEWRWDPIYGNNGGSILQNSGNEKNWCWFEHDGQAHLIYMTEPHEVASWVNGEVFQKYETEGMKWKYGHMRGGTPPIRVGDEYICFFHSSMPWKAPKRQYFMGAYAFEAKPPFKITRMTKKPILSGSQEDPWHEGLPLVVFPCGAVLQSNKFLVTMGVNDYVSSWIEIPLEGLNKLMA